MPANDLFDLSGQVAIVTGSTKGIGKAIAARYAQYGAKVVVSSRKADACEQAAEEINRDYAARGGEAWLARASKRSRTAAAMRSTRASRIACLVREWECTSQGKKPVHGSRLAGQGGAPGSEAIPILGHSLPLRCLFVWFSRALAFACPCLPATLVFSFRPEGKKTVSGSRGLTLAMCSTK